MKEKRVVSRSAAMPPDWEIADAAAMQAVERGEASPEQQKRAIAWWITKCAGTYDLSYRPGDTHDTSFAEGRRFVGLQTVKLLKINISALRKTGEKS